MLCPAQIVGIEKGRGCMVKTGDSVLLLEEVQVGDEIFTPQWRIGTRLGINLHQILLEMQARIAGLEAEVKALSDHD